MSKVRLRFAPSPTGPLHIGGVRTALFNYLFARKNGGDLLLRIEDTDQNRFVPGAEEYIVKSLKWLGITFDEGPHVGGKCAPYRQSERKEKYREYADRLIESGHAYYAFDSTEELDAMRDKLKAAGMSAQYDAISRMSMNNSLTLPEDETKRRLDDNVPYVIRIKLPRKEEVKFHDLIRGWVLVQTAQMDDKVLFKSDGMPTYHLANVVDDYLMGITHVIRGEEWLPSAPLHVMLYRFLGWESSMPEFAHLPLILKPEGHGKLSKRDGDRLGFPVFPMEWKDPETGEISSGYKETGYDPKAVVNLLALLGWHPSDNRELFSMEELIEAFSIEKISKNGAKFDVEKAKWFNHQYLLKTDNLLLAESLLPEMQRLGFETTPGYLGKVIGLVKEKVNFAIEIPSRASYFFKSPETYDTQMISKKWNSSVASTLDGFSGIVENIVPFQAKEIEESFKNFIGQKGLTSGQLLQPLRVCISGETGGPPLFEMMALLGPEGCKTRLSNAIQTLGIPA